MMENIYLAIPLASLFGAAFAGLFCRKISNAVAHSVTILGVATSFILSLVVFNYHVLEGADSYNQAVYTWMISDGIRFEVGFLVDSLTAMMMVVVTFVSLMVHVYTIGYMKGESGYNRFFSYISLFTFSMLMLVMANNFMQLFFGWEAVGLVSYLLIGFYFKRDSAVFANMKAFLVNRVGDFGFLLGIAAILMYFDSVDYYEVFAQAEGLKDTIVTIPPGWDVNLMTLIGVLLFIGAMGKSAQVPLHVWLPDSMEGPTPISALIHAATMVTAGIFLVARMSPLYELSDVALSFVLIIGALTAFFMGLIGIVQNDIKRVVAYSTLSQLGYMVVALGASAYAVGVFHLMTHAFFKALLFLAAGSVIIGMHHDQDIRNMGGLRKYMPITYFTSLVGSLALIGFPFFSGFFSKDAIIEAVKHATVPGAGFAYILVLMGVFVTAFYSFRMFFLVFHTDERFHNPPAPVIHHDDSDPKFDEDGNKIEEEHDHHHDDHHGTPKESPWVVTIPLIALAIPSVIAGYVMDPMVVGSYFDGVIYVDHEAHPAMSYLTEHWHGYTAFVLHAFHYPAVYLALAGLAAAAFIYLKRPDIAKTAYEKFGWLHRILDNKYGFDDFNQAVFGKGTVGLGRFLWRFGDAMIIDGWIVNGTARTVGWVSSLVRHVQTGYLYHYAFSMILGLLVLVFWFVFK